MIREIIREAEAYLGAQLTAGVAADQRAIAFTSVLAAAAVVIVGAGVGVLFSVEIDPMLGLVALAVGMSLIIAMGLAIISAMPATFEYPGNSPAHWADDLKTNKQFAAALAEQADHYTSMIRQNGHLLRRNARQLQAAVLVAWGGLAMGILAVGLRIAWLRLC